MSIDTPEENSSHFTFNNWAILQRVSLNVKKLNYIIMMLL